MYRLRECLKDESKVLVLGKKEKRFFKSKVGTIYRKDFNHAEFVGQELCDMRRIPTARYVVIAEGLRNQEYYTNYGSLKPMNYDFRIGSYDFKKDDATYFTVEQAFLSANVNLDNILSICPTRENKIQLLNELEELIALDTYMGQTDRTSNNIMFKKDKNTKEVHLAPIYDYEYSLGIQLLDKNTIYKNAIVQFKNPDDYKAYMYKHPGLADKLAFYLNVDLMDTVRRSYQSRGLEVPSRYYMFYDEFDENRKKVISKILK